MLNKDFQLITKGGSSRGNRGYSASSPNKLNHYNVSWYKKLTDECRNRIQKAIDICNSYNYDNSDAMTDYFDVGFYQHFELRNKGLQVA